jgi:hypothetical protein
LQNFAQTPKIGLFEWFSNMVFCHSATEGINGATSKGDIDYGQPPQAENSRELL